MRITAKGRVTIPAAIRRRAGILPGSEIRVAFDGRAVVIELVREHAGGGSHRAADHGAKVVAHLRAHAGDVAMTTDEIMRMTRGGDASSTTTIEINCPGRRSDVTGHRDECEIKVRGSWQTVEIAHALGMDRGAVMRCPECHGPVRAHKAGTTGQRAHFEHLRKHAGCSLKATGFSGTRTPHPDALD